MGEGQRDGVWRERGCLNAQFGFGSKFRFFFQFWCPVKIVKFAPFLPQKYAQRQPLLKLCFLLFLLVSCSKIIGLEDILFFLSFFLKLLRFELVRTRLSLQCLLDLKYEWPSKPERDWYHKRYLFPLPFHTLPCNWPQLGVSSGPIYWSRFTRTASFAVLSQLLCVAQDGWLFLRLPSRCNARATGSERGRLGAVVPHVSTAPRWTNVYRALSICFSLKGGWIGGFRGCFLACMNEGGDSSPGFAAKRVAKKRGRRTLYCMEIDAPRFATRDVYCTVLYWIYLPDRLPLSLISPHFEYTVCIMNSGDETSGSLIFSLLSLILFQTISIPLGGNGKQAEYSFSLSSLEDAPTSSSSSSSGGGLSSYIASSSAGVQGSFECLSSRAGR